jgi:hypothetical protein
MAVCDCDNSLVRFLVTLRVTLPSRSSPPAWPKLPNEIQKKIVHIVQTVQDDRIAASNEAAS